jgi:hypothetical protein
MSDLSEFVILDQLIQLIYLGPSRFFLLSTLDSSYKHWNVHLGLAGAEGRWWGETWSIEDVHRVAVRTIYCLSAVADDIELMK